LNRQKLFGCRCDPAGPGDRQEEIQIGDLHRCNFLRSFGNELMVVSTASVA
jgi:hypothetical protein